VSEYEELEAAFAELREMGFDVHVVDDEVGGWYALTFPEANPRDEQWQRYAHLMNVIMPYLRPRPPQWSTEGL
jgi:hypothetical protein